MDIFAHGLWSVAGARALNRKLAKRQSEKRLNVVLAAMWGFLPDLIAFAPIFVFIAYATTIGGMGIHDLRPANETIHGTGVLVRAPQIYWVTNILYSLTHSIFVFLAVVGGVVLLHRFASMPKRTPWEMGMWLVHIMIDIPTHSLEFYPTPFLWPFSDYRFDGFAWGSPEFQVVNYSLLVLLFFYLRLRREKRSNS